MSRTVELRIGGQNVRVVSSAPEAELQRLAGVVNRKLAELGPGRAASNGVLLVAMALAHEVEEERRRRTSLEQRVRGILGGVVARIDRALGVDGASVSE